MRERVALLSVSDPRGLEGFAKSLLNIGFKLYATESTRRRLVESGLEVKDVSEITGSVFTVGEARPIWSGEPYDGF